MEFLKWVAAIVLIIMVYTWSRISIDAGFMMPVSNTFMSAIGTLVSIVAGQGIKDAWNNRPGGKP